MKITQLRKTLFLTLAAGLLSTPALAQLSLSTSADASAEAGSDGAAATADGDATAPATTAEPAPAPIAAPAPVTPIVEAAPASNGAGIAGYDGGFYIQTTDGDFKLKINGIGKTRWELGSDEWPVIGNNLEPGKNHTWHSAFTLPYTRLVFSGNMFGKKLKYMINYDFAPARIIYSWASWTFIPEKLQLKVGMFKRPFSRAYITSSAKRQNIRGRENIGELGADIDVGMELSNNYTSAKGLEWAVGVFNGELAGGINTFGFEDFSPVLVGRIGYNNGIKGYSETDFEGGPLRFGVALSASTEFDHNDNDITTHNLSVDGMIKVSGLSVAAAVYLQSVASNSFWDVNSDAGQGLSNIGAFVQAGYLIHDLLEPTARYSMVHDYRVDDDLREQISVGLIAHFIKNHRFKWNNQLTLLTQRANTLVPPDRDTYRDILFSSELQFFF